MAKQTLPTAVLDALMIYASWISCRRAEELVKDRLASVAALCERIEVRATARSGAMLAIVA